MLRAEMEDVAASLAALPARYREPVVLRFDQELTYSEVAEVLGQPVGTVKSNVHRALKMLRGEKDDRVDD
jgi:RNA polymerase sigma-70 factor (ECF subfamily)